MDATNYFIKTQEILENATNSQKEAIIHMAKVMGDCMVGQGLIQLFGIGPDRAFAMELGYRAGGLMPYHQLNMKDLVLRGHVSLEEMSDPAFNDRADLAEKLWNLYTIDPRDMVLIYAAEEVYDSTLALAKIARQKGHKVLLVASFDAILNSKHKENAAQLIDLTFATLNLCTPYPDTVLEIMPGIKITQVANVVGNCFAQMLTAETYRYLVENGHDAPILLSANVTGADVHNRKISDVYLGRWNA